MPLEVDVPLNTAIADLDEALRALLRRELQRHGFEGVDVAFDAPSREWSGKLTAPTVDLFLYDLREAIERAQISPTEQRANGQATVTPPPLELELTYAVTAWTKAVEDEHRLLSQVLAVLFSYRRLPAELLASAPEGGSVLARAETSVGRPHKEKSDFWTSVGGQYKASIDLVARIQVASGAKYMRGPEVRTQTIRTRITPGPASTLTECHRIARDRQRPRGTAGGGRVGRDPGRRALDRERPRRPLPVRPDRPRQPPRPRPHGRRRRGRDDVRRCPAARST